MTSERSDLDRSPQATTQPVESTATTSVNRAVWWLAMTGVALTAVAVMIRIWTVDDRTTGDVALIELEVRRALTSDPPVLGAYSRFGWRHPGPIVFYLMAVPYRVLGGGARALASGALLLNTGIMVWALHVVRRRGTAALAAFAGALLLLVSGMGGAGIGDAWNVSLTLVPLCALVIGCWGVVNGDRSGAPLALASFVLVVETHVGAGVVATPLVLATATVVAFAPVRRRIRLTGRRVAAMWMVALLAISPIVFDTLRHPPGNLFRLVRWAAVDDRETIGVGAALRLLGRTSSWSFPLAPRPPRFLLWADTDTVGVAPGCSLLVLTAIGIVAWRRREREVMSLVSIVALLWASALVAAQAIATPLEWWLVEWLQPLGWITLAAVAHAVWTSFVRTHPTSWGRFPVWAGIASFALVVGHVVVDEAGHSSELDARAADAVASVQTLSDAIEASAGSERVRIDISAPDFRAEDLLAGLVVEAIARDIDVCVGTAFTHKFPDALVCSRPLAHRLLLRTEPTTVQVPDGYDVLRIHDPLTPSERERLERSQRRIATALEADGRIELVGSLDTQFAADVLLVDPGRRIAELRSEIEWLDSVRTRPGRRFVLYQPTG